MDSKREETFVVLVSSEVKYPSLGARRSGTSLLPRTPSSKHHYHYRISCLQVGRGDR